MNIDVVILFVNATLITVLSAVIVIFILRKHYLPVIKKAEQKAHIKEEAIKTDQGITHQRI